MPPSEVTLTTRQMSFLLHSMRLAGFLLVADSRSTKDALLSKMRQAREALSKAETFANDKYLGRETSNTGEFND